MERVAITGGAGFVGTNLATALCEEGYEVVVVDNFSTGLRTNLLNVDCEIKEVSIENKLELNSALKDCSYIFHLAARGSVPRSIKNPIATFNANCIGTLNVLEIARQNNSHVAFSSSSSVYGSNLQLPKSEMMWMAPLTPYAASKLSGEALVASYAASFNIPAITYRFFNIFGPWQRPDHDYAAVIPKWIWKLMHNQSIEVFGDGNQSRDFTYIDTVVAVLVQGLKERVNHPNPVNLAFGSRVTLNECIEELREKFPMLEVAYLSERAGDVRNSQNDPTLIKSIFPQIRPIGFPEALESTYQWFLKYGSLIANGPHVTD